jgi:hypothetical protein
VREPRLPERRHASRARRLGDAVRGLAGGDPALHLRRRRQDLDDRQPPAIAGSSARRAAARTADGRAGGHPVARVGRRRRPYLATCVAETSHEPLRKHAFHRRRDLVRRNADVDEPSDGARGVVRVQRREHEVTGERRLDRDLGRLAIADLADEDDVGVLAHDGAERRAKGEAGPLADLHLDDTRDAVLDGVLDRDDVHAAVLDLAQRRVERGRLPGSRRAGDEDEALARLEQPLDAGELRGGEAHAGQ